MVRILVGLLWVAVLGALVSLGVWQLTRLAWKQGVIAEIAAQIEAEAGPLPTNPDPEIDRYRPVQVTGAFEVATIYVLVSTRDFGPGFRLISPFVTDDGRRIMIDRGFVRTAEREAPRSFGTAELEGNLHWPDERNGSTPEDDVAGNWWYARDVDRMAAHLGTESVLVIARTRNDPIITPLPVTTEAIRNKHLEYAMTWFLFAGTWVVMTVYALWRIRRRNNRGEA